jgi:hypothetical protein
VKKHLLTGLMALLVGVMLAGPAAAQYPPAGGGVTISSPALVAGGSFTVMGTNWLPGSQVVFTLHSGPIRLGTATVAADGTFSTSLTIPVSVSAGRYTLVVSGFGADGKERVERLPVTVAAAKAGTGTDTRIGTSPGGGTTTGTTPGTGVLAITGMSLTVGMAAALALFALGGVAFTISRRKAAQVEA